MIYAPQLTTLKLCLSGLFLASFCI